MMVQQSKVKTTKIIEKPLFSTVFRTLELTKCEFEGGCTNISQFSDSLGYDSLTCRFLMHKCVTIRAE